MGSPPEDAPDRVDLGKHAEPSDAPRHEPPSTTQAEQEPPFDPYRYGQPDVPPPPEYAPPGYVPPAGYYPPAGPTAPTAPPTGAYPPYPYGPAGSAPYGSPPYGSPHYGSPQYGPAQYGPSPYGPQPYGPLHAGGGGGNGKAVAGMVLGIVSIVLFWLTFLDAIFVLLGLIFSLLGLSDAGKRGGRGRGQAIAGLICTAIGAVAAIAFTIFIVHLANKCGGFSNQGDPGYQQCLRDHL